MAKLNLKSMKKSTKDHIITFAMVIVVYIIVQTMITTGNMSSLMQGLLVPMCTYSIVAIGLNLCVGYLGELSIGHAGFMCVGAFSSAFCTKLLQDSIQNEVVLFLIAIAVGTVAAAFFGFLIGIPVLRLRGDYLAIVTLAFGEIIKNVINVLYIAKDENGFHFAISDGNKIELSEDGIWLINGAKGIAKIPHLSSFTAGVIMILVILFIVYNFVNSRTGRAVMAIRDNRIAAAPQPQMEQPMGGQQVMGQPMMGQPMMGQPMMGQPMMAPNMNQMYAQPVNVQPAQFQAFNPSIAQVAGAENIGLIMDVPLEVTVELGRTTKSIHEILDFAPGTIIELNRIAGEPIDILVNGKYVAKGEVVVIEESFGVRITEIVK